MSGVLKFGEKLLVALFVPHFNALFKLLDPVNSEQYTGVKKPTSGVNVQFAYCAWIFSFMFFTGNFVMYVISPEYNQWTLESFKSNPYILLHQMFPREIAPLTDPCLLLNLLLCTTIYTYLALNPTVEEKFKFYPTNNGQNLQIDSHGLKLFFKYIDSNSDFL